MHKLLERQLRRFLPAGMDVPTELVPFIDAIDATYRQSDDDRALLERSMEVASQEMVDRFRQLNDALMAAERTSAERSALLSLLTATLDSTTDGILVVDPNGRIVQSNRRFAEM